MLGKNRKEQGKWWGSNPLRKLGQRGRNRGESEGGSSNEAEEQNPTVLSIYSGPQEKQIAQVILNGYHIAQDGTFGSLGTIRSFKIVTGDLWEQWHEQTAVILADKNGNKTSVRVAALPVAASSFGLLEFVDASALKDDKLR